MFGLETIPEDPRAIRRAALEPVEENVEEALRADVLERARTEFGYVGERFGTKGPLAATLSKLDYEVLNDAQVAQYMKSKEHTWTENWRGVTRAVCVIVPAALTFAGILAAECYFNVFGDKAPFWQGLVTVIPLAE